MRNEVSPRPRCEAKTEVELRLEDEGSAWKVVDINLKQGRAVARVHEQVLRRKEATL